MSKRLKLRRKTFIATLGMHLQSFRSNVGRLEQVGSSIWEECPEKSWVVN